MLNIRSYGWMADNLSWSQVIIELFNAFDELGHNSYPISTNGINEKLFKKSEKMVDAVLSLQRFGPGKKQIDVDLVYTLFPNLSSRFLPNSKHKCCIYNYEFLHWPKEWKKFYKNADYYFPSSNFSAEVFLNNGVPNDKVFVIPHGVDTDKFNANIPPIKLKTNKSYRFLSICAPHYRKKLHILLDAYCRAFTKKDDVCLVLKTKVYKHSDGIWNQSNTNGRKLFEIVLGDIFKELNKKYGDNIPEIEIFDKRIDDVCSLFNSCNTHVTTTGSECWGIPSLESMAAGGTTGKGMISIAPNYSGQLHFMNSTNSLLINTKLVSAQPYEQYWAYDSRNKSGEPSIEHTAELMNLAHREYDSILTKFKPEMERTISEFSWINAAKKIINVINGETEPYKLGTYKGLL